MNAAWWIDWLRERATSAFNRGHLLGPIAAEGLLGKASRPERQE